MESEDEELFVQIGNRTILCQRELLVANSDYFKAMLEGDFLESGSRRIKLQGITPKTFDIILAYLGCYEKNDLDVEDTLLVLQASCMFQFLFIKTKCVEKLTEILHPRNCIQIWKSTEQLDIKPLFLKARCMALEEFSVIKDMDYIPQLHLNEISIYLGHISLNVDNEFDVFQTALKWWYENSSQYNEPSTKVIIQLLSCVVYKDMNDSLIREMMTYPDLRNNNKIIAILEHILQLKISSMIANVPEQTEHVAIDDIESIAKQLWSARSRQVKFLPCIFFDSVCPTEHHKEGEKKVIYKDKYKRKRLNQILEVSTEHFLTSAFFDPDTNEFKELFQMDKNKYQHLDGFKLLGYKEFVFMFGGEYLIGKGDWNYNFWVYDTFREKWERKARLPYPRRHFESCIVGSSVYIIGGAGLYRVIQENLFWYNFKHDNWSKQITLPCSGRQIKCCSFENQLFLLDLRNKFGYLFNEITSLWTSFKLDISDDVIANLSEFSMFCYKSSIYLKGKTVVQLQITARTLTVTSVKTIHSIPYDKMESALCNNFIYTLYINTTDDTNKFVLEQYDLATSNINYVFSGNTKGTLITINDKSYTVSPILKLFSFHHYSLGESYEVVNDMFLTEILV